MDDLLNGKVVFGEVSEACLAGGRLLKEGLHEMRELAAAEAALKVSPPGPVAQLHQAHIHGLKVGFQLSYSGDWFNLHYQPCKLSASAVA